MHQDWFFLIFEMPQPELTFEIESEGVKLSSGIEDKRMIGPSVYSHYFHVFESLKRTWLVDIVRLVSQLSVGIASIAIALVLV